MRRVENGSDGAWLIASRSVETQKGPAGLARITARLTSCRHRELAGWLAGWLSRAGQQPSSPVCVDFALHYFQLHSRLSTRSPSCAVMRQHTEL